MQIGTITGRLSVGVPSLQNIPIKGEISKSIRTSFYKYYGIEPNQYFDFWAKENK